MYKVEECGNIKEFVEFPYILFKNDKYWCGDLKKSVESLLSPSHPFWENAERKLFVVKKDRKIAGRICAILNHAYNNFHNENSVFFGFFDSVDDFEVSRMLFKEVENWAARRGCSIVRGPANPSSNYTWGMLIENFNEPNVIMMPYNPPYYNRLVEDAGYYKEKDLYAFKWVYDSQVLNRFDKIIRKIEEKNKEITLEFIDPDNFNAVFNDFKAVYNKAWEKNWGFVPMSEKEIEYMAKELKPVLKKEYVFFAREKGNPVGFCFMMPDLNIAIKLLNGSFSIFNIIPFIYRYLFKIDCGRLFALGVNNEYRNRGIEILMILKAIEVARKLNWRWGELSWTLEDNIKINKTIEKFNGRVYKKYRIYRKDIKI